MKVVCGACGQVGALWEVLAEQPVGVTAPARSCTLARKGRCLVEAKRLAEAHDRLHEVRDELAVNPAAEPALLAEARPWHAETIAVAQMRDVVAHRAQLDLPDSPRLLAARLSLGAYLMQLGRPEEGLGELQEVVHHRSVVLAADDQPVVDARTELASCLMVLGRIDDAFVELDEVVRQREAAGRTDDFAYLVIRQQRAVCLRSLGRFDDADRELDAVMAASGELPADHPFVQHLQALRQPVTASAVAE